MRICDKCAKKLREGDGNIHIEFGLGFNFDICHECEEKFLLHISSFFRKKTNQ